MKSLILDNILFKLQYFGNSSYHYQAKYKSKDKLLLIESIKTMLHKKIQVNSTKNDK